MVYSHKSEEFTFEANVGNFWAKFWGQWGMESCLVESKDILEVPPQSLEVHGYLASLRREAVLRQGRKEGRKREISTKLSVVNAGRTSPREQGNVTFDSVSHCFKTFPISRAIRLGYGWRQSRMLTHTHPAAATSWHGLTCTHCSRARLTDAKQNRRPEGHKNKDIHGLFFPKAETGRITRSTDHTAHGVTLFITD